MSKYSLLVLFLHSLMNSRVDSIPSPLDAIYHKIQNESVYSALNNDTKLVLELVKLQGQKIESLEEMWKSHEEVIKKLEKTVEQHSDKIQELSSDMKERNTEDKILENDVKKLEQKILRHFKDSDKTENGLFKNLDVNANSVGIKDKARDAMRKGTPDMPRKSGVHDRKVREVSRIQRKKRDVNHISFSAYLSKYTKNLGAGQIVKFDRVITNDGNAYNAHTGVFTAPRTGTYVFVFYVSSSNADVAFELKANGIIKASAVARPSHHGRSDDVQGGGTVILRLYQDVSVWIENIYTGGFVYSTPDERWVTFSGFLLY